MRIVSALVAVALLPCAYAHAADTATPANPISTSLKIGYERTKKFVTAAAAEMPPGEYAFKPTPEVRSFGQLIGHIADASYMFCSAATGKPGPKKEIEKTITSKDALQKALAEAFTYCDGIYAASTDAALTTPIELFGRKMVKFTALDVNVDHDNEHYGNLVTYLRLKKLTPPSSMPEK
jgi:uncharacterized damage-inducible protein DinB